MSTYRDRLILLYAEAPTDDDAKAQEEALGRLHGHAVTRGKGMPDSVSTSSLFGKPAVNVSLALNRKTTENHVDEIPLAGIEPKQAFIPVAGLEAYIKKPRLDHPDVAKLAMRDGSTRWVIQEGHTRIGAAVLHGKTTMPVRVWEFTQNERGAFDPVPRGLHKRGLTYREKLLSLDDVSIDAEKGLADRYDMPDIADVSFPTMIGARKKKPRVRYKGVSLSRKPSKFEAQVLSLDTIPRFLDESVEQWMAATSDEARTDVLLQVANEGARQVLLELVRQGAPSDVAVVEIPIDVAALASRFRDERETELSAIRSGVVVQLSARQLSDETRQRWTEELVDRRVPALNRRYANFSVNEAFAYGRKTAINLFQRTDARLDLAERDDRGKFISLPDAIAGGYVLVDAIVQTAVMDLSTCEECEDVDGEVMDFGSSRQRALRPPYVKCLGGLRCRCVQIAILSNGKEIDVDEIDEDTLD